MSELLLENNETPRLEWEKRNLPHVLRVDIAHAIMLSEQGLITKQAAALLVRELENLKSAGSEAFTTKPGYGSILLQVEAKLATKLGEDTAGRLSIARSRLDQGATVWRLSYRERTQEVLNELAEFQDTLLAVASKHSSTPMISYTHLQQAQPAVFGHYLLAFRDRLQDSFESLTQIYDRVNRCPLGAVGLSGTDLPIDRVQTASLLGFSEILENTRLGRDAYYHIEITTALTLMLACLNDLCTDLHIFSSVEFGIIELDDSHTSTSSIFPQKKNPYGLETIKARAADAHGWSAAAFASFRNEGSGDTGIRGVGHLEQACVTSSKMLKLANEVIYRMTVKGARCDELLERAWVTTNRLSNVLLTSCGMSNRTAHGVVARLVKLCLDRDILKKDVTVAILQEAAGAMGVEEIAITQETLESALDHKEYIANSISLGSIGLKEVKRLEAKARAQNWGNHQWVTSKEEKSIVADKQLEQACLALQDGLW